MPENEFALSQWDSSNIDANQSESEPHLEYESSTSDFIRSDDNWLNESTLSGAFSF